MKIFINKNKEIVHQGMKLYHSLLAIAGFVLSIALFSTCSESVLIPDPQETPTYTITYDANGADSGNVPAIQNKKKGESVIIANNIQNLVKQGHYFAGWNTDSKGKGKHYNTGNVYTENKLLTLYAQWIIAIKSSADFQKMHNNLAGSFVLLTDLDLPDTFKPIGTKDTPFTGTFAGKGHTLSNLKLIDKNAEDLGFFGSLKDAHVSDLVFNNPHIEGKSTVGVLAGYISGSATIKKVLITGASAQVHSTDNVGMLIGKIEGISSKHTRIEDCEVAGIVTGRTKNIGGMIGALENTDVKNCKATAKVVDTGDCSNTIGGLAGLQTSGIITNSYATGTVMSKGTNSTYIGGLVGTQTQYGAITNSYATGEVISKGSHIGGLVGSQHPGSITNSCATGEVSGFSKIGGLVGSQHPGSITNSYATGKTSCIGSYIGGLVGHQLGGNITDSYFDHTSTEQPFGIGKVESGTGTPTGYNPNDLTMDKFSRWSISSINSKSAIWHWVGTNKWPILRWQYEMQKASL